MGERKTKMLGNGVIVREPAGVIVMILTQVSPKKTWV